MKIKKFISLLAATAMFITNLSINSLSNVTAANESYPTSGKCGDNIDWLINSDGVLVISGNGEMKRPQNNWGWAKLNYDINEVVIENGITSTASDTLICPFGYHYCSNLSKIILPPTFTKLEKTFDTVNNFKNLKDIYIYSENVTDTAYQASNYPGGIIWHVYKDSDTEKSLRNDLKLTDEDIEYIPDNEQMPTVSNKTPAELEPLTETSGPSGLSSKYEWNETSKTLTFSGKGTISIADYYKNYAEETEHIIIESGITQINTKIVGYDGAFTGFTTLRDVQLTDGIVALPTCAFYGNANLEEINFPNTLNYIGEGAFNQCSKLKSIKLHEGMTIGGGAFHSCISLKEITIPKNTTFTRSTIGGNGMSREQATFANCTGLEKIIIEDGCWLGDSWGNEITPNGIPSLFCSGCTSLKTIIIKGSVEYISLRAFEKNTSLTNIYLYNTGLKTITARNTKISSPNVSFEDYTDSFDTTNNPTFHVVQGSQTEQTLRDAGYLTADNTKYVPDITDLQSAIDEAEKIDTSKYTNNTLINNLKTALENAKSVINNLDATQVNVDAAVKALNDAISALTKPNTSVTPTPSTSKVSPTTRSPEAVKKDKAAAEKLMQQAKITQLKVKSKSKKKINVSWKKVKNAVGYQVQVSKKRNFKKNKIIFNKFTSKKKLTISKKIKSKKTYFVRVRAYATYKDTYGKPQKVYSKWNNKLRKVKVK